MVVVSFVECVAETEAEMKMHVEIAASSSSEDSTSSTEAPLKAVVYWLNPHTGYFMAPGTSTQPCIPPWCMGDAS